jgi:hypothetical protein
MLLEKIKADSITARKAKDTTAANLLTTLYSEAAMVGKNIGNRESTDVEVMSVIAKFLKNAEETFRLTALTLTSAMGQYGMLHDLSAARVSTLTAEIRILKGYMPQQLTEQNIGDIVSRLIHDNAGTGGPKLNMGMIMAHLKATYGGQYDGKMASAVVKRFFEPMGA